MPFDLGTISDVVAMDNAKTSSSAGSGALARKFGNDVSHDNRMNILAENALGSVIKNFNEADVTQAAAISEIARSNNGSEISSLLAALSGGEIGSKTAGVTPPVTVMPA